MNRIENGTYAINDLSSETHKSFPIHYGLWEEKSLKHILAYLDYTKYNEINISHSLTQKNVS